MTIKLKLTHEGDSRANHRLIPQKRIRGNYENYTTKVEPGNSVDVIIYKDLELIISEERINKDQETDFGALPKE